jgi:hypothetical protein
MRGFIGSDAHFRVGHDPPYSFRFVLDVCLFINMPSLPGTREIIVSASIPIGRTFWGRRGNEAKLCLLNTVVEC